MTAEFVEHLNQISRTLQEDDLFYMHLDKFKYNTNKKFNLIPSLGFIGWIFICILFNGKISSLPEFVFILFLVPCAITCLVLFSNMDFIDPQTEMLRSNSVKDINILKKNILLFQRNKLLDVFLINQNRVISLSAFLILSILINPTYMLFSKIELGNSIFLSMLSYFWLCPLINLVLNKVKFQKYRYWRSKDEFNISNLSYYYRFPYRYSTRFHKFLAWLGKYDRAKEILKAEASEIVSSDRDVAGNLVLTTLLMNNHQIKLIDLIINHDTINIDKTAILWIGLRVLKKEIRLNHSALLVKQELHQNPLYFSNGKTRSFWDLAILSQDPDIVEGIYVPGLEFLPSYEGESLISRLYTSEIREWFKTNTLLFKDDYLPLLGGWNSSMLLIGAGAIPKLQFIGQNFKDWDSLKLKNKRLKKLFYEKLIAQVRVIPENPQNLGMDKETQKLWEDSKLTGIHGNLVNLIMELKEFNFDLNLVANYLEKINFTDLAFKTNGRIWLELATYGFTGINKPVSVFYAYTYYLLKYYSKEKTLKILMNSLYFGENYWRESLNSWLRVDRNPNLFVNRPLPAKVKDISVLNNHFEKIILYGQNPDLPLDQKEINCLSLRQFEDWTIHIPEVNKELIDAGAKFRICLGNAVYYEKIIKKQSYIFFLKIDSHIQFIVEISPKGEVIQARTLQNIMMESLARNELSRLCNEIIFKSLKENS